MTADELLDHTPLRGGKHPGKTPSEIADIDPSYLVWAYEGWDRPPCSAMLYKECVKDAAELTRQNRVAKDQDRE